MATQKNVTEKELAQILFDTPIQKGMPMFASVLQRTEPKTLKKDRETGLPNPYREIHKVSKVSIILNSDYERAVERQLEKEGKDSSEYQKGQNTMPLTFGEKNQFIGLYKGDFVLQYRPNDNTTPETTYFADGKEIEKSKISGLLPVASPATNQGTDREIFWRKLYLKNVLQITMLGTTYNVIR